MIINIVIMIGNDVTADVDCVVLMFVLLLLLLFCVCMIVMFGGVCGVAIVAIVDNTTCSSYSRALLQVRVVAVIRVYTVVDVLLCRWQC